MRFLHGPWVKGYVREIVMLARMTPVLFGPRLEENGAAFLHARGALPAVNAEPHEFLDTIAAAHAKLDAPVRKNIHHRDIFGKAQRIMERQEKHTGKKQKAR